jgi:hypothetical protein
MHLARVHFAGGESEAQVSAHVENHQIRVASLWFPPLPALSQDTPHWACWAPSKYLQNGAGGSECHTGEGLPKGQGASQGLPGPASSWPSPLTKQRVT